MSLTDLADRSGIALATLSRLEAGKNPNPTFETLSRIATALGLELKLDVVDRSHEKAVLSGSETNSAFLEGLRDSLGQTIVARAHHVYRQSFANLTEDDIQAWVALEAEVTLRAVSSALASDKFRATVQSALKAAMAG